MRQLDKNQDGKVSLEDFTQAIKEFISEAYDQKGEGWNIYLDWE